MLPDTGEHSVSTFLIEGVTAGTDVVGGPEYR